MSCVVDTSSPRGKRRARSALPAWKRSTGSRPARRVAADLVERQEAHVAVERRVLDALGHHRRRRLLEARGELARRRRARTRARAGARSRASAARSSSVTEPVRARRRCGRPAATATASSSRGMSATRRSRSTSGANVVRACSSLASCASVAERARRPTAPRTPRLGGRVAEQRGHVVGELVADRALDRPVAQLLVGIEDLLHPDVLRAAVGAAAAGSRPGRRARRGGRSAARRRRPRAPARAPAGGSRRRPPGPPSARPPARRCRRSAASGRWPRRGRRTCARSSRSAQKRVGVVGGHVVGHDVEDQPHPALARVGAQRAQLLLPAQLARDRRRVDRRRSRASSPRAPARPATGRRARCRGRRRYGQQLARGAQVEVGAELQAVGRAERARRVTRAAAR